MEHTRFDPAATWLGPEQRDQRGLRIGLVALFLALTATAPVLHFADLSVRTQSSIPQPAFTWPAFWNGEYMKPLEQWLREASPLTYQLRGLYAEARYLCGIADSDRVLFGKDGWMVSRAVVDIGWQNFENGAEQRRRRLVAIRDRCDRLGVKLAVVVPPDSITLYPEVLEPRTPALRAHLQQRQRCYPAILAELGALQVTCVDIEKPMRDAKRAGQLVCHRGDTHWTDVGASAAAVELASRFEQSPYFAAAGPEVALEFHRTTVLAPGDTAGLLGMRSEFRGQITLGSIEDVSLGQFGSPLLGTLYEAWPIYSLGANTDYETRMRDAAIALCGDSYANRSFKWQLATRLKRLIDWTYVMEDSVPAATVTKCLDDIEQGICKAKVVIWEFVERKYLAEPW